MEGEGQWYHNAVECSLATATLPTPTALWVRGRLSRSMRDANLRSSTLAFGWFRWEWLRCLQAKGENPEQKIMDNGLPVFI